MKQARWIDRIFEFNTKENILPAIIERLEGTPIRLAMKVLDLSEDRLRLKRDGKWSLKEHIGHVHDLEPLWMGRLEQILAGAKTMQEADMSNKKTNEANHNIRPIGMLLQDFQETRLKMVARLRALPDEAAFLSAQHPRLKTPMRVMDLFQFVAEHDDQHLAQMHELVKQGF